MNRYFRVTNDFGHSPMTSAHAGGAIAVKLRAFRADPTPRQSTMSSLANRR